MPQDGHDAGASAAVRPVNVEEIVDQKVAEKIDQRLKFVRVFLYGFLSLVIVGTGLGLFTELDILRMVHRLAFPVDMSDQVAYSYHGYLELTPDQEEIQTGYVAFFAEEDQTVKAYFSFAHQFPHT